MVKNRRKLKKLNSQSGQGMTEYILLIVIVLAVAMVFKEPIKNMVSEKLGSVSNSVQGFSE